MSGGLELRFLLICSIWLIVGWLGCKGWAPLAVPAGRGEQGGKCSRVGGGAECGSICTCTTCIPLVASDKTKRALPHQAHPGAVRGRSGRNCDACYQRWTASRTCSRGTSLNFEFPNKVAPPASRASISTRTMQLKTAPEWPRYPHAPAPPLTRLLLAAEATEQIASLATRRYENAPTSRRSTSHLVRQSRCGASAAQFKSVRSAGELPRRQCPGLQVGKACPHGLAENRRSHDA